MAADERWYFTKEQIFDSPSRKCAIDQEKELSYRRQAASLIHDIGLRLNVAQLVINTAVVYMHRFYMHHSFTRFHRNSISAAAIFLAAKVEEQPRKLEHVIKKTHFCLYRTDLDTQSEGYLEKAQELIVNENILLQTLGFDVAIDHPHSHVVKCCQLISGAKPSTLQPPIPQSKLNLKEYREKSQKDRREVIIDPNLRHPHLIPVNSATNQMLPHPKIHNDSLLTRRLVSDHSKSMASVPVSISKSGINSKDQRVIDAHQAKILKARVDSDHERTKDKWLQEKMRHSLSVNSSVRQNAEWNQLRHSLGDKKLIDKADLRLCDKSSVKVDPNVDVKQETCDDKSVVSSVKENEKPKLANSLLKSECNNSGSSEHSLLLKKEKTKEDSFIFDNTHMLMTNYLVPSEDPPLDIFDNSEADGKLVVMKEENHVSGGSHLKSKASHIMSVTAEVSVKSDLNSDKNEVVQVPADSQKSIHHNLESNNINHYKKVSNIVDSTPTKQRGELSSADLLNSFIPKVVQSKKTKDSSPITENSNANAVRKLSESGEQELVPVMPKLEDTKYKGVLRDGGTPVKLKVSENNQVSLNTLGPVNAVDTKSEIVSAQLVSSICDVNRETLKVKLPNPDMIAGAHGSHKKSRTEHTYHHKHKKEKHKHKDKKDKDSKKKKKKHKERDKHKGYSNAGIIEASAPIKITISKEKLLGNALDMPITKQTTVEHITPSAIPSSSTPGSLKLRIQKSRLTDVQSPNICVSSHKNSSGASTPTGTIKLKLPKDVNRKREREPSPSDHHNHKKLTNSSNLATAQVGNFPSVETTKYPVVDNNALISSLHDQSRVFPSEKANFSSHLLNTQVTFTGATHFPNYQFSDVSSLPQSTYSRPVAYSSLTEFYKNIPPPSHKSYVNPQFPHVGTGAVSNPPLPVEPPPSKPPPPP